VIFSELARRLACEEIYTQGRSEMDWVRHLYGRWRDKLRTNQAAIPDFDGFWKEGFLELPRRADDYIIFGEFRADPEKHRLATPSGKIELYSERIAGFGYDDCPPHPTWLEPAEWLGAASTNFYPLHLISSQPRYRLHSQMDCGPISAQGKVADREAVAINPADAASRGIADGDVVRLHNDRGACLAGAVLTDSVSPGVVRLSCGAWYDPGPDGTCMHGNANVLTFDRGTSKLGQGPSSATVLIDIERLTAAALPVTAFVPPRIAEDAA
jgi:biotin/methionine sulfoxide reductase